MIREIKDQQYKQQEGIDIIQYVEKYTEIQGSNSTIFEVVISDFSQLIKNKMDKQFFNQLKSQEFLNVQSPYSSNNLSYQKNNNNCNTFILKEMCQSQGEQGADQIKQEIDMVKKIRSMDHRIKGLVYLINYAIYETDNNLRVAYILMERGEMNLSKFMKCRIQQNQPLQYKEYLSIVNQTINALADMQSEKIAHNDIKPANILVFRKPLQQTSEQNSSAKDQALSQQNQSKQQEQIRYNKKLVLPSNHQIQSVLEQNVTNSPIKQSKMLMSKSVKNIPTKFVFNDLDKNQSFQNEDPENQHDSQSQNIGYEIEVKFCDIGSSQANQSTLKNTKKPGTDTYLAPETFTRVGIHLYKYDVFSLGLCFINMVLDKTSNFYIYMKKPWIDLMPIKDWLGILEDVLEEWIRILSLRMKSEETKKLLTLMLKIDRNERPDFLELRQLYQDLFDTTKKKEEASPNSQVSPTNNIENFIENNLEITKTDDSKEEKKKTITKNIKGVEKQPQRRLKIYENKNKAMVQLGNQNISDTDSPVFDKQVKQSQQQQQQFAFFDKQESQSQSSSIPILQGLQSQESQMAASQSPNEHNDEWEESPIQQDEANENSKYSQFTGMNSSKRQLKNNKGQIISQQSNKKVNVKQQEINLMLSVNSFNSSQLNFQGLNSSSTTNFQSQNIDPLIVNRKKSSSQTDTKKVNLNPSMNIAESIVYNNDQIQQSISNRFQNQASMKQSNMRYSTLDISLSNFQSSLNYSQAQQLQSYIEKKQSLYQNQIPDTRLTVAQTTRNSQPIIGQKKDIAPTLSTRVFNNNLSTRMFKQIGFKQEDNESNKNSTFSTKNQIDYSNPTSFTNLAQISQTNISTQITSLTNMQAKNPFNSTITNKNSKSFKDVTQNSNNIDSPQQQKVIDKRQKYFNAASHPTSSDMFKLPRIQQAGNYDSNIPNQNEPNGIEASQNYNKNRNFSIQDNIQMKQINESDNSGPPSPQKQYSKSFSIKGDLTPQMKQSQAGQGQKSKFSNQKYSKQNLSSTKLNPLQGQNNGQTVQQNNPNILVKVTNVPSHSHRGNQSMANLNTIANPNNNNYLSTNTLNLNNHSFNTKLSNKSLSDQVNENFEQVIISDFSEMLKFQENFIKVSEPNRIYKYLTLNLNNNSTNKANNHGIMDCLYKLDGLCNLTIQFNQQKTEVIDWALDILQTIGGTLQNLSLTFNNCEFNSQGNLTQSDFLKRDSIISDQKMQLIVRFEGKNCNQLDLLEKIVDKLSQFQDKIRILNLDLMKKNLVKPNNLVSFLKSLQKYKQLKYLGLDVSQNNMQQNESNQIFQALEQLPHIHTLSLNISQNQNLFDDTTLINFPHTLQILYLNISNNKLSTLPQVKLQKAISACQNLNTVYLYFSNCLNNQDDANQFMCFIRDLFKQVQKVGIFSESNSLTDSEFKLYESDLLIQFKVEVLTLSLNNKNILSFQTFKIITKMIKMQTKLKQATLTFPRTVRKQQIIDEFQNQDREYILTLKNYEFDYFTVQIDIIKRREIRRQSTLSVQTGKNASLTFIPHETISNNQCWNISKQSVVFQGYQCLTCYENNLVKNDSYYCLHCIKTCHGEHKYIEINEFPSIILSCSCNEKGIQCESYKQLQSINNNINNNIIPFSPFKPQQK